MTASTSPEVTDQSSRLVARVEGQIVNQRARVSPRVRKYGLDFAATLGRRVCSDFCGKRVTATGVTAHWPSVASLGRKCRAGPRGRWERSFSDAPNGGVSAYR